MSISLPNIRFQPFVAVNGFYDTGLSNVGTNERGELSRQAGEGIRLSWGVSGTHSTRHSSIGLNYRGSISHYINQGQFDSIDQHLMLGIRHQLSSHVSFMLNQAAGTFSRDYGLRGLPETVPFDPSTTNVPTTDYFDNRTYYLSTQTRMLIQKTRRLSFSLGGDVYVTRRRSKALTGYVGQGAQGDLQYRLTRRLTIGAQYAFSRYSFDRTQSDTVVHSLGPTLSMRVTRWFELTGAVGVARIESKFIQSGVVDPAIAALLGITSVERIVHRIDYLKVPTFNLRASHGFRNGVIYATAGHSVRPGNGLFLTSYAYTTMAGYSYTGLRHWSAGAHVAYTAARSIGNIEGFYNTTSTMASVSRNLFRHVHFTASSWARRYSSETYTAYNRNVYGFMAGLAFTPGEMPLRLW